MSSSRPPICTWDPGGAGYLNASFGAGALLAGFVTAFLVGRRRLKNTLVLALLASVAALALVSTQEKVALALLLLAATGLAGTIFDVTGRTLLQRSSPSDAVAGLFSVLEAVMDLGLALGAVVVQVTITLGGIRAALLAPAIAGAALIARALDPPPPPRPGRRHSPHGNPTPARHPHLRRSARAELSRALRASSSRSRFRAEPHSSTKVIPAIVTTPCPPVRCASRVAASRWILISRGQGFGEIALIRDVPRSATVTAVSDATLYALRKDLFVQTVTGHPVAAQVTGQIITGHLGDDPDAGGQQEARPA